MADSQTPKTPQSPSPRKRWSWLWGAIALVGASTMGAGGYFVYFRLNPLVERSLVKLLNRPFELGELQGFSFNGATFGASALPPTADDLDSLAVEKVKVTFNPWRLVTQSHLDLKITVYEPQIFLEQNAQMRWLDIKLKDDDDDDDGGGLKVTVDQAQLIGGRVEVISRKKSDRKPNPPVVFNLDRLRGNFNDDFSVIRFQGQAQSDQDSDLAIRGEWNQPADTIDLEIVSDRLQAPEVTNLVALPLTFTGGTAQGTIALHFFQDKLQSMAGELALDGVTSVIPQLTQPLHQGTGKVRFEGQEIQFQNLDLIYGFIPLTINGQLHTEQGYNLQGFSDRTTIAQIQKTLEFEELPFPIEGPLKGAVTLTGAPDEPLLDLQIQALETITFDRLKFNQFGAQVQITEGKVIIPQWAAVPDIGGQLSGKGLINLPRNQRGGDFVLQIQGQDFSLAQVGDRYEFDLPIPIDRGQGTAEFYLDLEEPEAYRVVAQADFPLGGGAVQVENLRYQRGDWQGDFQILNSRLDGVMGKLDVTLGDLFSPAPLTTQFTARGSLERPELDQIVAQGQGFLQLPEGKFRATQWNLAGGIWQGDFILEDVGLRQFNPETLKNALLGGSLSLSGQAQDFTAAGSGRITLAEGDIEVKRFALDLSGWTGETAIAGLPLEKVMAAVRWPVAFSGDLDLTSDTSGVDLALMAGTGAGHLDFSTGQAQVKTLTFDDGQFQTAIATENLPLGQFNPTLKGAMVGAIEFTGSVTDFNFGTLTAQGKTYFTAGLGAWNQPLHTEFLWDGQTLALPRFWGENLAGDGVLALDAVALAQGDAVGALENFDLTLQLSQFDLRRYDLPPQMGTIPLAGFLDFRGTVGGTLDQPQIQGDLVLNKLSIDRLRFHPTLSGTFGPQDPHSDRLTLALQGGADEIMATLGPGFQPQQLRLKSGETAFQTRFLGDRYEIESTKIPIDLLKSLVVQSPLALPPTLMAQPLGGLLTGKVTFDPQAVRASGQLSVEEVLVGKLQGDRLGGRFSYGDRVLNFQNWELVVGEGEYELDGQVNTRQGLDLNVQARVRHGQVQELLQALQVKTYGDLRQTMNPATYLRVEDLWPERSPSTLGQRLPRKPFTEQLEYFTRWITAYENHLAATRSDSPWPELYQLQGIFDAQIEVNYSDRQGISADFRFNNTPQRVPWQWGPNLTMEAIRIEGQFADNTLTIQPASIGFPQGSLTFRGSVGAQQQGQFVLRQVPLELLENLFTFPPGFDFTGVINSQVALSGTLENPLGKGSVTLENAAINNNPLTSLQGNLNFHDGRLDFAVNGELSPDAPPLVINGTVPYQWAFAPEPTTANELAINVELEDEGLVLMNMLTDNQLQWLGGEGQVSLAIAGKVNPETNGLENLQAQGLATIDRAQIKVESLPDAPLSNVSSRILFNFDELDVKSFSGDFSGGKMVAQGKLALLDPLVVSAAADPLVVQVRQLKFVLPDLYRGGVDGDFVVRGALLKPEVGGQVNLYNGTVILVSQEERARKKAAEAAEKAARNAQVAGALNQAFSLLEITEFKDLRLNLGRRLQLTQAPILNFLASGEMVINGTLLDLKPQGQITLERGQVNLFTTLFSLDSENRNTATFSPGQGVDPYLDVWLKTAVVETQTQLETNQDYPSEVVDTSAIDVASLQTVRIQAKVNGLASRLDEHVVLSSRPNRSEVEIIGLLGGNFIASLAEDDSDVVFANLAGSALLGTFQNFLNNAVGLSEVRLFPTLINDDNSDRSSILGVGAELGLDLTRDLSLSSFKILNSDRPFQYGLRYRFDNNFLMRGSSDFQDDSRVTVEFEQRF